MHRTYSCRPFEVEKIVSNIEDLPGFFENKGTWPFTFREQKENKTGITGTKAYFRKQGHQNRRNTFREQGNARKNFVGKKGTWTSPLPPPSILSIRTFFFLSIIRSVFTVIVNHVRVCSLDVSIWVSRDERSFLFRSKGN